MVPLEIHPADLPLRIDAGDPVYAVGRVFIEENGFRGASIFTLINPVIRLDTYSSTRNIGQIQVIHPNLRDDTNDYIRIGFFEFDSLQFMHTYDNIYKYRGWLTAAKAYDPESAQRLIAAQQDEGPYDYLPPDVMIRGHVLPFPVSVEVCYNTEETLKQWVEIIES